MKPGSDIAVMLRIGTLACFFFFFFFFFTSSKGDYFCDVAFAAHRVLDKREYLMIIFSYFSK